MRKGQRLTVAGFKEFTGAGKEVTKFEVVVTHQRETESVGKSTLVLRVTPENIVAEASRTCADVGEIQRSVCIRKQAFLGGGVCEVDWYGDRGGGDVGGGKWC